ncbi:MAG: acyl-ACP--UDP-N-acetylglucosamine O-acyltransferase [Bacteroidota bacterium]
MNQPLAYIHPQAKIADNVVVEPFATIHKNVEIGEGSWIGSHASIMEGARIGKNVRIFPGAVISAIPQDLKFAGEDTVAIVGDNTSIREFVTVSRGTADKHKTEIGKNCLIMAYVHVAHDCIIGNNCILANTVQLGGHVMVDDWAVIGGSSSVHQFSKIGAHVMISGGSLVRKDVPPFTMASREPLSYTGINSVGLRRRGFSNEKINEIQEIYRIVYLSGYSNSKALDFIKLELPPSKERDEVINFILNSDRGIMKGYNL